MAVQRWPNKKACYKDHTFQSFPKVPAILIQATIGTEYPVVFYNTPAGWLLLRLPISRSRHNPIQKLKCVVKHLVSRVILPMNKISCVSFVIWFLIPWILILVSNQKKSRMEVSEEVELDLNWYFLRPGGSDLSWQVTVLMLPRPLNLV